MHRKVKSIRYPRFSSSDGATIDCFVLFEGNSEEYPYTSSKNEAGICSEIWRRCKSEEFGAVLPFVGVVVEDSKAEVRYVESLVSEVENDSKDFSIKGFLYNPLILALFLVFLTMLFSIVYTVFFSNEFKGVSSLTWLQSVYFSVITASTTGYGDITPLIENNLLIVFVTTQNVLSFIVIGLFFNSIAHKISTDGQLSRDKDSARDKEEDLKIKLEILRPIIDDYLRLLSITYKVTYTGNQYKIINIRPAQLFNVNYYDQISLQNFEVFENPSGLIGRRWAEYVDEESSRFIVEIDKYLGFYANGLPSYFVKLLVDIKSSHYLGSAKHALKMNEYFNSKGIRSQCWNLLSIEHSSIPSYPGKQNAILEFHENLLKLVRFIDGYSAEPIVMEINLRNSQSPPVGSAIAERINPFGC